MKAQDLRIGNFVFDDQNETCSVSKLLSQKKISFEGNGVEDWEVEFKDEKADNIYLSCVINPIPLTEEWVIKFGFVKESDNFYFLPMPQIKAEIHFEKKNYGNVITMQSDFGMFIPNDIDFVHKLQNLYHALTGEELTLKETNCYHEWTRPIINANNKQCRKCGVWENINN